VFLWALLPPGIKWMMDDDDDERRAVSPLRLSRQCGIGHVRDFRGRTFPSCTPNEFVYFVRVFFFV